MFNYLGSKETGNVQSKMDVVVETQQKLYKSLSKLVGDAVTDYDLIGNLAGADEDSARLATNYMQVMALSKEFADKLMEANVELAVAIDLIREKQKTQDAKLDRIIRLLEEEKTEKEGKED